MTKAPGRPYLLGAGIVFIVNGGVSILTSLIGVITSGFWDRTLPMANGMSWSIFYSVSLLGALLYLYAGIRGVKGNSQLEQAEALRGIGIICMCYVVVSVILNFFAYASLFHGFTNIISLMLGAALPILYIVGAGKNLEAYNES